MLVFYDRGGQIWWRIYNHVWINLCNILVSSKVWSIEERRDEYKSRHVVKRGAKTADINTFSPQYSVHKVEIRKFELAPDNDLDENYNDLDMSLSVLLRIGRRLGMACDEFEQKKMLRPAV